MKHALIGGVLSVAAGYAGFLCATTLSPLPQPQLREPPVVVTGTIISNTEKELVAELDNGRTISLNPSETRLTRLPSTRGVYGPETPVTNTGPNVALVKKGSRVKIQISEAERFAGFIVEYDIENGNTYE